mmetsp:Transcript_146851/g.469227  ORF Transcript_146851/g.469227 Transcript_146851/m.469227 type:complete len:203 (-) Transcript_146851:1236-1844(-)
MRGPHCACSGLLDGLSSCLHRLVGWLHLRSGSALLCEGVRLHDRGGGLVVQLLFPGAGYLFADFGPSFGPLRPTGRADWLALRRRHRLLLPGPGPELLVFDGGSRHQWWLWGSWQHCQRLRLRHHARSIEGAVSRLPHERQWCSVCLRTGSRRRLVQAWVEHSDRDQWLCLLGGLSDGIFVSPGKPCVLQGKFGTDLYHLAV